MNMNMNGSFDVIVTWTDGTAKAFPKVDRLTPFDSYFTMYIRSESFGSDYKQLASVPYANLRMWEVKS